MACAAWLLTSFPSAVQFSYLLVQRAPQCVALAEPRARTVAQVQELNEDTWNEALANEDGLNVVKFYAPWCRTCKAISPQFDRSARQALKEHAGRVNFYQVNFKENKRLCFDEQVFQLPTIHFYMPSLGRVSRFAVSTKTVKSRLTSELDKYLGDPGRLDALQKIRTEALQPMVRYNELMGMLQGLANAQSYVAAASSKAPGVKETFEDKKRLTYLERLFHWIDRDGSGRIDADELAAAVDALAPTEGPARSQSSALLDEIAASSGGKSKVSIDLNSFIIILTCKAVAEFDMPQKNFLPAFQALDKDGDGTISRDEMFSAMENVISSLPDPTFEAVKEDSDLIRDAFDAFDLDSSGTIDYEEYVSMVSASSRGFASE